MRDGLELDLGATRVELLTRHRTLKGGLLALKTAAATVAEQTPLVREALRLLREDPSTLQTFVSYLGEVVGEEALPLVEQALQDEHGEEQMRSINQYWEELGRRKGLRAGLKRGLEKGLQKGLERGLEKGREESLRTAVAKVLAIRFKKLPPSVEEKLAKADAATLEAWLEAAVAARSLRAVFH